ncbi:MAG: putative selenium-dependent hydroxylase accessory protein YqeC [Candidatus Brocadiae bacterium]|nr:putative selenium-dependent hydroxylase accessory protein YqeC [Candidatus Brocadiia bacterium]
MQNNKKFNFFLDSFQILQNSYVSIAGSGGKSTLMKKIALESSALGWPTILTSTTHIHIPFLRQGEPLLFREKNLEDISAFLEQNLLVLVSRKVSDIKAKGLDPQVLDSLKGRFLVLVEADGSKKKPFKIPASWEPVVPCHSTHAIVVFGLDALEKPLTEEWVHRGELLECDAAESYITPALVARTLAKPSHYLNKFPPGIYVYIYLAGCVDAKKYNGALEIARSLKKIDFQHPVFTGNLEKESWIEKISSKIDL